MPNRKTKRRAEALTFTSSNDTAGEGELSPARINRDSGNSPSDSLVSERIMHILRRTDGAMADITTLFWDNGGVILTNGWDRGSRKLAVEKFHLDWAEFEDRHELMLNAFEKRRTSLDEYLRRTVFYRERAFTT